MLKRETTRVGERAGMERGVYGVYRGRLMDSGPNSWTTRVSSSRGMGRQAKPKPGAAFGLHRSNRLPWNRSFLESAFKVSHMGPASS